MNFRKTIAGISAVLIAAGPLAAAPMTTFADDKAPETTEQTFTEGKIKEYLYAPDKTDEIQCRFYPNKPNIPYVKLSDFYKTLNSGTELSVTKNEDGTYLLETTYESKAVLDTKKDTLTTSGIVCEYGYPDDEIGADSATENVFFRHTDETIGEPKESVFDFGSYDIDIIDDNDGEIWWPITTLANTYQGSFKKALYIAGELYFVDSETEFTDAAVLEGTYEAVQAAMGESRPEDLIQYDYNELCRVVDTYYGFPGCIPLNDVLAEKGLDGLLAANDDAKLVKSQLLSKDYADYVAGVIGLQYYLEDGGHTAITSVVNAYTDEIIQEGVSRVKADFVYEGGTNFFETQGAFWDTLQQAAETRASILGADEEGATYRYIKKGDTAMFSFDGFMDLDWYGWGEYYNKDGAIPTDTIIAFKNCLEDADKDENIKNFIVDLSSNTGGYVIMVNYMMDMMGGNSDAREELVRTGVKNVSKYTFDKNFDRVFDDKDAEVKYDLNFGVITTSSSFSSANLLPYAAKDSDFMLIGEQSGGGACCRSDYMLPSGGMFSISDEMRSFNAAGENIDPGVKPDYELVTINDDGTKDYSKLYDFDIISKCFADYYGKKQSEDPQGTVTTTAATTGKASETTTTTAASTAEEQTSTSASSSAEASSSTTTAASSTEAVSTTTAQSTEAAASTTTDTTGELPQTGNNSLTTVAVVFTAITLTASGSFALAASRKKDEEE